MIPVAKPSLGEAEAEAARKVILSGWVTQGPKVKAFEDAFARAVGARFACAVSSCTAALHLALLSVGVKPGDVVITVSHSFIATANAVRYCGAEPVFVDIDRETYNMDPQDIVRSLAEDFQERDGNLWYKNLERLVVKGSPLHDQASPLGRLAAILAVHQVGMPADLARILPIARKHGIPVVEDAACALGSEISLDGRTAWDKIGQPHGEIACFSFHPRKMITTGDGGMLTTNNTEYDQMFRLLRHHGMSVSDLVRHQSNTVILEEYLMTGYNYRMTDIQAAVGIEQLKRLPQLVRRRRALARLYSEALNGISGLQVSVEPTYARTNWQSYIVRLVKAADQKIVMKRLQARGIQVRRGVMCAHMEQPYMKGWRLGNFPNSETVSASSIVLPLYYEMTDDDAMAVVQNLIETMINNAYFYQFLYMGGSMPSQILTKYRYLWPLSDISSMTQWNVTADNRFFERTMPEGDQELSMDSRWPTFYPSPICLVTTSYGSKVALERSVGASIVNRFPYVLALSFCKQNLSERHYARKVFSEMIEKSGSVAVQFLSPGPSLDKAINAISALPEDHIHKRIDRSGLTVRKAMTNEAPVFTDAYIVYEASLVKPCKDFAGLPIYQDSWLDVGSHRVYFFEINAIQLRKNIARGNSQILWRSLPAWKPLSRKQGYLTIDDSIIQKENYQKGYRADYCFPSSSTTAFEADSIQGDMAIKYLPPLPEDQVEIDNDRARWPCFFPASLSLITAWAEDGIPNMMPCGSTMVVSRHPLTIAPCISYAAINERYSPRATLNIIRRTGTFGCGVPFIHNNIINAIQYTGNISLTKDARKVQHAGLEWESAKCAPILPALPVYFECRVVDEIRLGTHCMFLGEVRKIRIRTDVGPANPLEWFPWAEVKKIDD